MESRIGAHCKNIPFKNGKRSTENSLPNSEMIELSLIRQNNERPCLKHANVTHILQLPDEVLLKIFDNFHPIFLLRTVSEVCKRFQNVVENDSNRLRYYMILLSMCQDMHSVPIYELSHGSEAVTRKTWIERGRRLEAAYLRWQNPKTEPTTFQSPESLSSIHMLKNTDICLVGSKTNIHLWNIQKEPKIKHILANPHPSRISCFASYTDDSFLVGAQDRFIPGYLYYGLVGNEGNDIDSTASLWQIREHSCDKVWSLNTDGNVLSINGHHNLIGVSTFGKPSIFLSDPRDSNRQYFFQQSMTHRYPAKGLCFWENFVLFATRTGDVLAIDLRNPGPCLSLYSVRSGRKSIGKHFECLAIQDNLMYVGDSKGTVHIIDALSGWRIHNMPVAYPDVRILSIFPDGGTFICKGSDNSVRIVVPSKPFQVLKTLVHGTQYIFPRDRISSMSFNNERLAIGKYNGSIEIYKP